MLAATCGVSTKVVALMALAATTVLVVAALIPLAQPKTVDLPGQTLLRETTPAPQAPRTSPQPAPTLTITNAPAQTSNRVQQPSNSAVRAQADPGSSAHASSITPVPGTATPPLQTLPITAAAPPKPLSSSDPARTLALFDRKSDISRRIGRELFERVWTRDDPRAKGGDGLGPVFNGQSCVGCHNLGGSGGAGSLDRNIDIVTASGDSSQYTGFSYSFSMDFGAGRFEYRIGDGPQASARNGQRGDTRLASTIHAGFLQSPSVVLHRFGTDPTYSAWRESVPGRHGPVLVRSSERNPPPLFGAGRIDSITDEAIEATARRRSSSSAQPKGRVSRLADGRIGRFGWKAQTATLEEFVLSAAAGEMGLELPGRHQAADPRLPGLAAHGLDMDQDDCNLLIDYVRSLPAPIASKPPDEKTASQVKAGEATFRSIGCASCHLSKLGDVEGIYTDLLLHDMGPQLADSDAYTVFTGEPSRPGGPEAAESDRARSATGPASVREWRTPPLWGLRDSAPYLHDGRAPTIAEAITLHGGQGGIGRPALRRPSPQAQTTTRGVPPVPGLASPQLTTESNRIAKHAISLILLPPTPTTTASRHPPPITCNCRRRSQTAN